MLTRIRSDKSLLDSYRFIKLSHPGRHGRSAIRIAEIIGARTRTSRRDGSRLSGFDIRVWKTGARRWDRTLGFVAADADLDFATEADLVRVGLVTLNDRGERI